jgi:hypothetical protein
MEMRLITSAPMETERLLRLAAFLDDLSPHEFNLDHWVGDMKFADQIEVIAKGHIERGCGTTACALGWAATIPEFREAGFGLAGVEGRHLLPIYKDAKGREFSDFQAAMHFFNLSSEVVTDVFYWRGYGVDVADVTPAEVASKLRKIVSKYEEKK